MDDATTVGRARTAGAAAMQASLLLLHSGRHLLLLSHPDDSDFAELEPPPNGAQEASTTVVRRNKSGETVRLRRWLASPDQVLQLSGRVRGMLMPGGTAAPK